MGLHHRNRMVTLMQSDPATAIEPAPHGLEQRSVQAVEFVAQRLQDPLGVLVAAGISWGCVMDRDRGFPAPARTPLF
jgi:hypothetical protein